MALNQIPDVDVSKLEKVCVWSELPSLCCFLQKGAGVPGGVAKTIFSMRERATSNWNPNFTQRYGEPVERADTSKEWSKAPRVFTTSLLPLPGDWGAHH